MNGNIIKIIIELIIIISIISIYGMSIYLFNKNYKENICKIKNFIVRIYFKISMVILYKALIKITIKEFISKYLRKQ